MSRPWMPLYVADYLKDTGHLSAAEHGAYLMLIMHYWANGGLPDDDRKLARIAKMDFDEWLSARDTIREFFADGWRHSRIDKELSKCDERSEKAKDAAAKRWNKPEQCDGNANALPEHVPSQCKSQSQSHISSLRSEIEPRERAFVRFWQIWPNKVGKPAAEKAFAKVWREADAICEGVDRYIAGKPADRPWLNPATFLNQRRWEDCPAPEARAGPAPIQQTRNGWGALAADILEDDRRNRIETARGGETLRLLSLDGDDGCEASGADIGGLPRQADRRFG